MSDSGEASPAGSWCRRHPVWMVLLVLLLIGAIGSVIDDDDTSSSASGGSHQGATERPPQDPTDTVGPSISAAPKSHPTKQPPRKRHPARYLVLAVVDGDTVDVAYQGSSRIRVIGIDTPETVSPSVSDECGGPAASRVAHELLDGKSVTLTFDPSQGRRDRYGRLLAYIGVPGTGDFGLAMIKRGRAAEYPYDTAYRQQSIYQAAEGDARATGRHMWGDCGGPDKPLHKPKPPPPPAGGGNCAAGYDPCIPPYPPDLDCADVNGPIHVTGNDPHGLDRDGDGIACEP